MGDRSSDKRGARGGFSGGTKGGGSSREGIGRGPRTKARARERKWVYTRAESRVRAQGEKTRLVAGNEVRWSRGLGQGLRQVEPEKYCGV